MKLTNEQIAPFVGGQMEIQNINDGYLYRGEIETITIADDSLVVRFAWIGKGVGYPPLPTGWVEDATLDYQIGLSLLASIQPSITSEGIERLILQFPIVGELVVLFPPNIERKLKRRGITHDQS